MPIVVSAILLGCGCARSSPPPLWQAVEVPTDADFVGVWFADSLNGWLTGGGWDIDGGIVGRTRDGGRAWSFQSGVVNGGGKGFAFGRVQFFDSLTGCMVGRYGRVMLTQDGGTLWRRVSHSGTPELDLIGVQFIDRRLGWAVGTGVVRTDDGGETWEVISRSRSDNGYLNGNAIHFLDAQRGWLTSHGSGLMHTDDGGWNWAPVPLPYRAGERPTLRDITFVGDRLGWVVGESGCIFHTDDGGASWRLQESGVPVVRVIPKGEPPRPKEVVPELEFPPDQLAILAVRFADAHRGWAVGYYADVAESVVLGTRDGGEAWAVEHIQQGERLHSLYVLDTRHAWAAGDRERTRPQVVLRLEPGSR